MPDKPRRPFATVPDRRDASSAPDRASRAPGARVPSEGTRRDNARLALSSFGTCREHPPQRLLGGLVRAELRVDETGQQQARQVIGSSGKHALDRVARTLRCRVRRTQPAPRNRRCAGRAACDFLHLRELRLRDIELVRHDGERQQREARLQRIPGARQSPARRVSARRRACHRRISSSAFIISASMSLGDDLERRIDEATRGLEIAASSGDLRLHSSRARTFSGCSASAFSVAACARFASPCAR